MLEVLLRAAEAALLSLIAYNLVTALAGWRHQRPAPNGARSRRFRVVIPAHNEEAVIGALLEDLEAQSYGRSSIWVLADRCTDRTVETAETAGVNVASRTDGQDGKGAALGWYLAEYPLQPDEALVVLDADNRVPTDLLARFADELDAGHLALQAYLDVSNPDASAVASAAALSHWASNRMVQLARSNLSWAVDLGGTGMCLTAEALETAGGFGNTLTEDQEMTVRLLLEGVTVAWVHDVRVRDEKPVSVGVAVRQRSRWVGGRRAVARRFALPLLARRSLPALDLAIRLIQPSRMGVALISAVLAGTAALGLPLLPWQLWLSVTAAQVLAPLPFLVRDGVERRFLVRYPLLVLNPLLKLPARLIRRTGWYHTPHKG